MTHDQSLSHRHLLVLPTSQHLHNPGPTLNPSVWKNHWWFCVSNQALGTTFLSTGSGPRQHTQKDSFAYVSGGEYSAELHVSEKWDDSNNPWQGVVWQLIPVLPVHSGEEVSVLARVWGPCGCWTWLLSLRTLGGMDTSHCTGETRRRKWDQASQTAISTPLWSDKKTGLVATFTEALTSCGHRAHKATSQNHVFFMPVA